MGEYRNSVSGFRHTCPVLVRADFFFLFFLIVRVMTVVKVLWRRNERSRAVTFACDRGTFFSVDTFVDEVF